MILSPSSASDDLRKLTGGFALLRQEYFVSTIGGLLDRIEELNPEEVEVFKKVIASEYDSIANYARGEAPIETKKVAIQCAKILGYEGDFLDLGYEAFRAGDIGSLFDNLEHLYDSKNFERARALLSQVYQELGNNQLYSADSLSEVKQGLLGSLAIYAFKLDCDDIAQKIVQLLEGEFIESDDPKILKYRRVVRTPEEFDFAVGEIWDLLRLGLSQNISIHLLEAVHIYAKQQVEYLDNSDSIEPEMMKYLTENFEPFECEDSDDYGELYDYSTPEGRNFFSCRLFYILAIVYQDALRAEYLLLLLEKDEDALTELIADIADMMNSSLVSEESPILDLNQIIYHRVLYPLLGVYQGIEYRELHGRIYRLMEFFSPFNGPLTIAEHQSQTFSRLYHFQSIPGLAQYYDAIVSQMNMEQGSIVRMHIVDCVITKDGLKGPQNSISIVYYVLEYILLYGVVPIIEEEMIAHMKENFPMSQMERGFLTRFYPQYF